MRPHSGKPKTGYREGRSKLRASKPASKSKEVITKKKREREVEEDEDLAELEGKQADLIKELLGEENQDDGQAKSDRFAREFKKLRKKVGSTNDHFNAESLNIEMLRAMLTMMLDIIPLAEQVFRKSKKESSAYALNALVNQARELSTDLRMAKDVEGQAAFIRDMILNPVLKMFTQQIISETLNVKNSIDTHVDSRKQAKRIKQDVDDMARALGKYLTESVMKLYSDIDNYLSGNMQQLLPQPKRSKKMRQS